MIVQRHAENGRQPNDHRHGHRFRLRFRQRHGLGQPRRPASIGRLGPRRRDGAASPSASPSRPRINTATRSRATSAPSASAVAAAARRSPQQLQLRLRRQRFAHLYQRGHAVHVPPARQRAPTNDQGHRLGQLDQPAPRPSTTLSVLAVHRRRLRRLPRVGIGGSDPSTDEYLAAGASRRIQRHGSSSNRFPMPVTGDRRRQSA